SWAPRYTQPRIDPRAVEGVPTSYAELADPDTDLARLLALPDAYDDWIDEQAGIDVGQGLSADVADEERRTHARDLEAYRRESGYIRTGIELLQESHEAARILSSNPPAAGDAREALAKQAVPWEAW